ncbi:MAG: diaminopimelate decarboxylase [Bacteroidota bacterium]|jgi:diaminopimelate decarboxylase|nr:diaminopimelate decarboxylase [Chitinophagaceae bacterium]MCE2758393.1 diaminopimelate decarboxylase [Chitinophagaceae bacterium]
MAPTLSNEILLKAAKEFSTPLYVYDEERIHFQYAKLIHAFQKSDVSIFYACKALSNINVLRIFRDLGAGIDCVSLNEVQFALKAGVDPSKIIFTPNSVSFDDYTEAVSIGVNINIDNLEILQQFGTVYGNTYPVVVRINPHILAGGNIKISTGHIDSKFGISIDQVGQILDIKKQTGLAIKGLHLHTGSEIKEVDVFLNGLNLLLELSNQFEELTVIDLGGGFKIPYKPDEKGVDIGQLGEKLFERLDQFQHSNNRKFQIWFEPGKFLVSEAGYFLTKANIIKENPTRHFIGVDSGFNHLIRPMFYDAYHIIDNISNARGPLKTYNVVGNICETDTFAWDRELPEVHAGDILMFKNAGAYGFEMSSRFNSRTRPAEVIVAKGEMKLIRRRETLDDLLQGQIL